MPERTGTLDVLYGTLVFEVNGKKKTGSLYRFIETFNNDRTLYGIDLDPEDFNVISKAADSFVEETPWVKFSVENIEFSGAVLLRIIRSRKYPTPLISPSIALTEMQFEDLVKKCDDTIPRELSFTALMEG